MSIDELNLFATDLGALREFYEGVLGLPIVEHDDGTLAIQADMSRLIFRQAPEGWNGEYHFAFDIPENRFQDAKAWLSERVPLLRDAEGNDEFDFESWNAHAIYFFDPAENIVEFIARHLLTRHGHHQQGLGRAYPALRPAIPH